MRHKKFVYAPLQIEFKSKHTKEWNEIKGFRNVAKALRWVRSINLPESAEEIRLVDPLSDQEFLYSSEQNCFREVV